MIPPSLALFWKWLAILLLLHVHPSIRLSLLVSVWIALKYYASMFPNNKHFFNGSCALFMDFASTFLAKTILKLSHSTIHTFKPAKKRSPRIKLFSLTFFSLLCLFLCPRSSSSTSLARSLIFQTSYYQKESSQRSSSSTFGGVLDGGNLDWSRIHFLSSKNKTWILYFISPIFDVLSSHCYDFSFSQKMNKIN